MDSEFWRRIRTVFEAAVELSADRRRAYLDQTCRDDQDLRDEVESLLAAAEQHPDFLRGSALERYRSLTRPRHRRKDPEPE